MKSISDRRMDRSDDVSSAINTETMASVVSCTLGHPGRRERNVQLNERVIIWVLLLYRSVISPGPGCEGA